MKLDPHLPQLPSLGELLEHPRVKGVVARINRSTIAQRATGFLDELRASLAGRSGKIEIPSVGQLAERLARRLLGEAPAGGPIINATGVVVGASEFLPPLADGAVHAMLQVASEYHNVAAHLKQAAEADLVALTGAEAALAVSSFDAALHLVLGTVAANDEIAVVTGSESATLRDWPKLAARHGAIVHVRTASSIQSELGDTDKKLAALFLETAGEGFAADEVTSAARRRGITVVDCAPSAGTLDPASFGLQTVETLQQRIGLGADLVIADGAGLLGGPLCGLLLGRRTLIEQASRSFTASLASIVPTTAAALQATLNAYHEVDPAGQNEAAFTIPVWQLLSAPLTNLRQRAERLSALIEATGAVVSAKPHECERPWLAAGAVRLRAPTWTIAIQPKGSDSALLSHLRRSEHPITADAEDGLVHLDLRSIFPRWDQQLVAAFEGEAVPRDHEKSPLQGESAS